MDDEQSEFSIDIGLLDRYLAGDALAPADEHRVLRWLAAESAHGDIVELMRNAGGGRAPAYDASAALSTFWSRKRAAATSHVSSGEASERKARRTATISGWHLRPRRWVAASGIVTLALVVGFVISRFITTSSISAPLLPTRSYATAVGEQASIQLSDGSRVRLAPKSRLTVSGGFGATSRTVRLTGEAYFDVRRVDGIPFIVRTGAVSTRVLGTTFDVRSYPSDRQVRIAVVSGKVASGGRKSVTLMAGRVGLVTDSTALSMENHVNTTPSWVQGRLVFDDVPIHEVLSTMGLWYGYEFRLADSTLARERISAVFKVSEPEETMETLRKLLNVTMTFDRTIVTLHARRVTSKTRALPRLERDTTHFLYTRVDQ